MQFCYLHKLFILLHFRSFGYSYVYCYLNIIPLGPEGPRGTPPLRPQAGGGEPAANEEDTSSVGNFPGKNFF